jgi:tRNA A-37 threonylcarbamoyl transferase component Bud32
MSDLLDALRRKTGLPLQKDHVVLLRNVGTARGSEGIPDDHITSRGFNLLLMDARGVPRYYAKCRSVRNARHTREAEILQVLQADVTAGSHLPSAFVVDAEAIRAIVMGYLPGPDLEFSLSAMGWNARVKSLVEVLRLVDQATCRIERMGLVGVPSSVEYKIDDDDELLLRELTGDDRRILQESLNVAASLKPRLQHGDLTARNVRMKDGRPVVLDYEACGDSVLPLADAWNLVRNLPRSGRWGIGRPDWWNGPASAVVRAESERLGMTKKDLGATLVTCLWLSAKTLRHRGLDWRPYMRDLSSVFANESL